MRKKTAKPRKRYMKPRSAVEQDSADFEAISTGQPATTPAPVQATGSTPNNSTPGSQR